MSKLNFLEHFIKRLMPYRRPIIVLAHAGFIALAYLLAVLLRFDFRIPPSLWDNFLYTLPLLLVIRLGVFWWCQLYEGMWRYVSMRDILRILRAVTIGSLVFIPAVLAFFGYGFPRSIFFLEWVLCLALVGGVRLVSRALRESSRRYRQVSTKRALIVGEIGRAHV